MGAVELEVSKAGAGGRSVVDASVAADRQLGAGSARNLIAATWSTEHQPIRGASVEPPRQGLGHRASERHQADARVALGPVLVAGAEPAGVVAHIDDLNSTPLQVHAASAQAEQLAASQPGPYLDHKVVAVERRAGRQKSAELLRAQGPSLHPAKDHLRVDRTPRRFHLMQRVEGDQPLVLRRLKDAVEDRPAGHHTLMPKGHLQSVLPLLDHLDRDSPKRMAAERRADMTAQPVLGGLQRRRASPRIGGPHRPPLVGPIVEPLPRPARVEPSALELRRLLAGQPPLSIILAGEATAVQLAIRPPVASAVALGPVRSVLNRGHRSCTPTLRGAWHRTRLDAASGDKGIQVTVGDTDMPTELGVGNPALDGL